MFNLSKKAHAAVDVKKSIQKILDTKKDSATRLKHLRIILENVDLVEAKYIFETHYSHIYYLFYDVFAATEAGVKLKPHRVHREDVESVLYILEHILLLLPELLQQRWQLHSITRVMRSLLHPGNILRLRREAVRMFVIWFQEVGEQSSEELLAIFATLVPGFPPPASQHSAPRPQRAPPDNKHVGPVEVSVILPPQGAEKAPDDLTRFFLECLMDNMVTQLTRIEWKDKTCHVRCFNFLFDNFKQFYLPHIFPDFNWHTNLYKPVLTLPELRRQRSPMASSADGAPRPADRLVPCRVVVIRWVANFAHASLARKAEPSPAPAGSHGPHSGSGSGDDASQGTPESRRSLPPSGGGGGDYDAPASLHSLASDSSGGAALCPVESRDRDHRDESALVRDVLFGSRQNVNFVHEVFRQAFLLSCHYSAAIKRVVLVYKDWIQINVQLPSFLLEPMEPTLSASPSDFRAQKLTLGEDGVDSTLRPLRARSEGPGAPGQSVRAGLQNTLQLFITNSANIFLLECSPEYQGHYLEDQVELCKRILNMYRYLVMNVYMSQRTWEQLLLVLLQVTTQTLSVEPAPKTREQTLGVILARPLFQTLIVTWVKANLNVTVTVELWDQFLAALSSLTAWEELIKEWAKTLETLTRVVARQVYDLDLNNLPLDRLTEQKSKRRRGTRANEQEGAGAWSRPVPQPESRDRTDNRRRSSLQAPDDSLSQHGSAGSQHGASPHPRKRYVSGAGPAGGGAPASAAASSSGRLVRSLSEGSLAPSLLAVELAPPAAHRPYPLQEASRKVSRSMDSLRGRVSLYSQTSEHDYHSRSPSPSSGLETNSIKESPMGLDLFGADGNSLDTVDSGTSEHRSVMSGGTLRGWLPDVAVVLWRRMLGALGNVNHIQSPGVHAQVFDFLIELSQTLIKIEDNLGVSPDNQSTRWPSELVPPLPLLVPWCVEALRLPDSHQAGRLRALRLLCLLLVRRQPTPLPTAAGAQLLRALHRGLGSGNAEVVYTLVRQCGAGFLSLELPACSLLVLDLIQACSTIAAAQELHGVPRTEAVSILGSLVCFPNRWPQLQALQPRPLEMILTTCPDLKDRVVSVLLKCGKREPSVTARCTALVALAVYLYEELTHDTTHERMKDAIHILLSALKCNSRIVGQVASDMLVLLTDHAALLLAHMPDVPRRIVEVTAATLETLTLAKPDPPPEERWLLVSLVFCLGEWCMKLPIDVLTEPDQQGKSLLLRVFKALSEGAPPCAKSGADPQPTISLTVTDPNEQVLHVLVGDPPSSGSQSAGAELSDARDGSASRGGTVKLAARAVISHLVNHLDHFPMLSGAVRLGSLVSEHDDLPLMAARDELSSDIFYAPNVQFFVLNNRSLLSLVELPSLDVPGGGVTAGLCTAHSQVRVILRDLGGKFCWDASILYGTDAQLQTQDTEVGRAASLPRPAPPPEQLMQHSKSEESLLSASLVAPPRFTVRHRGRGALPTWQDTEGDMDNLDDLLLYLGDTSPECTASEDAVSLLPSVLGQERHAEAITALLSQRSAELESARATDNSGPASACHPPAPQQAGSPFQHARLLFSQLGLSSWSRRPHIHLLRKSERLLRELRNVDNQKCRETHKIAVIYVALGQEDKRSILANSAGSQMFEEFVAGLAWEVELETHTGFMGGLQRNGTTGDTAPYYATSFTECLFHVSTRMPSHSEEALLQKTRHLGNDEVHVVWSEHKRDYRRGIIPTEFCDVLLVIYPLQSGLFRIQLSRKPEVPFFGPLFDGAIVGRKILPGLVRATALNASRAKRSMLPYYLNFFEERSQALETLISNHREASTFEELVGSVYSPAPPRPGMPSRTATAGPSREMSDLAALASALVDSTHPPLGPRSSWLGDLRPRADTDSSVQEVDLGRADPSPKTLKRLSFKTTVRKASSSIQETIQSLPTAARSHLHGFQPATTPPDSPAQRPRK